MARGPALSEGEAPVLVLRRAWYTLLGPALVLLICSGAGAFAVGTVPDLGPRHALRWLIAVIVAGVGARWGLWRFALWFSRSLRITTHRLILCDGLLARRGAEVPLGRVTDITATRTVRRRLLGAGRLTVTFAGGYAADLFPVPGSPGRGAVVLDDVPATAALRVVLLDLIVAAPRIAFLPPGDGAPAPPPLRPTERARRARDE